MEGWTEHPDYLTCGHIHKRQHIWNTDWARYTGSILPMSFSEVEYKHGVDMITFGEDGKREVEFIEYEPQHKLVILPKGEEGVSVADLKKLIKKDLRDRGADGKLSETYDYVLLKVKMDKVNNDAIRELEEMFNTKDAVLCKTQKVIQSIDVSTIVGKQQLTSIDDILNRDPMDTLVEAFAIKHNAEMSEQQKQMLREIINSCKIETE
jgi:exonuclease SbcD